MAQSLTTVVDQLRTDLDQATKTRRGAFDVLELIRTVSRIRREAYRLQVELVREALAAYWSSAEKPFTQTQIADAAGLKRPALSQTPYKLDS